MIVVKLIGGLGNQLFQYAAAKALAIQKRQCLLIDTSAFAHYKLHDFGLDHYNIEAKTYKKPNRFVEKVKDCFCKTTVYKQTDFGFDPNLANIKGCTIYLDGYFQSEQYFIKYQNQIRNEFELLADLKAMTTKTISHIQQTESVSVHIRRGDYVNNPLHDTDKERFYKTAMALIEKQFENPVYFVFSDDIKWAKENFSANKETIFIDFNDASTNFEDLKLMSSCKHNIIANSSFSWWGAWLNENPDKIVIAPKLWFNDNSINSRDIIPESWIKL